MFLYVKIHTLGRDIYALDVGLHRGVMYIELDYAFQSLAATWSVLALGSVDPEAKTSTRINSILDHLDQVLDRFITDYLAVNKTRMNLN
jgi:hypothetical protein